MEKRITFIILGGTGDLTTRKLIPALYRMVVEKKIGQYSIILCARHFVSIRKVFLQAKKWTPNVKKSIWEKIIKNTTFHVLDFYIEGDYISLQTKLNFLDKKIQSNRLFYLATIPEHFKTISYNLSKYKLARESRNRWVRVVFEKPFGNNLPTAKKLNTYLHKVFKEKQIYRIDHYLGKELVSNISLLRFTNRILEPMWSNKHVRSVDIVISEEIGVGMRGHFYDTYGAIKDVVQNHALQLLALTAMEVPKSLHGESVRNSKAEILKKTKVVTSVVGQYIGYRKEKGVKKNSTTETYANLQLKINTPRWRGVPFNIVTGKYMDTSEAYIKLNFKHVKCLLSTCPTTNNNLTITIQPDSGFSITLNSKIPGLQNNVVPVKVIFNEQVEFGPNTPQAYENLLLDVISGDQSVFVRSDEIEYAWKIVDAIKRKKLEFYTKGKEVSIP